MHDLVLKGGILVDGSGEPRRIADVAIKNGQISAIGKELGDSRQVTDVSGLVVAPGWVDMHTHYDGQVTWDPYLAPSSVHGVTTAVMGNCGVGFAPANPDRHDWLIGLMEGVEDIPGTALAEGIKWEWQTFGEYLNALDRKQFTMDIATQIPHGAVRAYVMEDRGAGNEPATDLDIERMAEVVDEGMAAGALGFSTSRTQLHLSIEGELVPGTTATRNEVFGIGEVLGQYPNSVFEVASDLRDETTEFDMLAEMSRRFGITVSLVCLQSSEDPENWRRYLKAIEEANQRGSKLLAQIACRGAGMLLTLDGSSHPFITHPTYRSIAHLPLDERLREMRKADVRERILGERHTSTFPLAKLILEGFDRMFPLGQELDYEPTLDSSIAARAEAEGVSAAAFAYDLLVSGDGRELIYLPVANYANHNLDHVFEMMQHPHTRMSLSDAGAHCGFIADASYPTFLAAYWARDRQRGPTISLEQAVCMQTSETAAAYGLADRGLIAEGKKADINVIDFERLKLAPPRMVHDLPAGGQRLLQDVTGYEMTLVSGVMTHRQGMPTHEFPGRLVRGFPAKE